jgi:hypothetical protein
MDFVYGFPLASFLYKIYLVACAPANQDDTKMGARKHARLSSREAGYQFV